MSGHDTRPPSQRADNRRTADVWDPAWAAQGWQFGPDGKPLTVEEISQLETEKEKQKIQDLREKEAHEKAYSTYLGTILSNRQKKRHDHTSAQMRKPKTFEDYGRHWPAA